jgi:hypothetical protein
MSDALKIKNHPETMPKGNQCPRTGAHFLFAVMCDKLELIAKSRRGLEFASGAAD